MNEPIISPWVFYWIDVLNSISNFTCFMTILAACFGTYCFILSLNSWHDNREIYVSMYKKLVYVFVVCGIICMVVPNKDTTYKMLVVSQLTKQNLQDASGVVDVALDKATERLIKVIQEAKK